MLPEAINNFIEVFSRLPSIGPRQATRLAFHILSLGKSDVNTLAKVVAGLENLKTCPDCFFIHDNQSEQCFICGNPQRKKGVIMIIEKETDLISLERTKGFNGRYFLIGNLKKNLVLESEQKLRLNSLKNFIKKNLSGRAQEIILAINPTTYGDITASLIRNELLGLTEKITRLGRGIPTGGEIEFSDEDTLNGALENRG